MYRYYSLERPVMPGTYPKPKNNPAMLIHNFNIREYVLEIGRMAWGYLEYENPLTKEQMEAFELMAASEEDKETICRLLCKVLQKTRGCSDLLSLDFDYEEEMITATFENRTQKINIAYDSGIAMIYDIVNNLRH